MSVIRPRVKYKNTILFKFSLSLSMLFLVMVTATYMVVDLVAKDYLVNKNKELIGEIGSHIVSEISQRISIAETLTRNLAAVGETLPKDPQIFHNVIPSVGCQQRETITSNIILIKRQQNLETPGPSLWAA